MNTSPTNNATATEEELPAPTEATPTIPGPVTPQMGSPLLEPSAPISATPEKPAGSIYLGLEAENSATGGIGVRVASLSQGSPAWKAGFQVGDRILAINGYAIASLDNMVEQLGKTSPGQSVGFLVSRGGRNIQLTAVLMDSNLASQLAMQSPTNANGPAWLGVTVNDLTESYRRQFGIAVYRGAAVAGVAPGSPANQAGIRAGDAIIEVDGTPIESARDLTDYVARTVPGQRAQILYYRGGFSKSADIVLQQSPNSAVSSTPRFAPNVQTPPAAESSLPSILSKPVSPQVTSPQFAPTPAPASQDNDLLQQLQRDNARLTQELDATRQRLQATERKLQQILKLLKDQ